MFPNYFQIVTKTIIDLFLNTRVIFVTIHYIHTRIEVHVAVFIVRANLTSIAHLTHSL